VAISEKCLNTFSFHVHGTNTPTNHYVYKYDSSLSIGKSALYLVWYNMVYNQTPLSDGAGDYDYIYNIIDYIDLEITITWDHEIDYNQLWWSHACPQVDLLITNLITHHLGSVNQTNSPIMTHLLCD